MKDPKFVYPIAGVLLAILVIGIVQVRNSNEIAERTRLATCLSEKGFSLAGTAWCPHCEKQREMFGDALSIIDYHDCEEDKDWCEENDIKYYPSWISPLGAVSPGVKDFDTLKEMAECR